MWYAPFSATELMDTYKLQLYLSLSSPVFARKEWQSFWQHKPNKWKEIPVLSHWVKSAREEALNCPMFWDERSSSVVQRDIPPTSAVSMAFICPPLPMLAVSGNALSLSCSCNISSKYLHHQTNCQDLCWCCRHTHAHAHTKGQQLLVTSHANQKIVLLARHVSIQETAPTHNPVIALHSLFLPHLDNQTFRC